MDFIQLGNMANSVKGNAKATAKPSMPMVGAMILPVVEKSTNKKPMIGPVHEKETSVRVNAMRKILISPLVFSALLSTELDHDEGNVISKAPKKEAAKITSNRNKKILNTAFVESEFNALEPKIPVIAKPRAR